MELSEQQAKLFNEAMSYIAGSCMIAPATALEVVMDDGGYDSSLFDEDLFARFLDANECFECPRCGWYGHPGETLNVLCNGEEVCYDCYNEAHEDEEEDE